MSLVNDMKTSTTAFVGSPNHCTQKSRNTKLQGTSFCTCRKASLTIEAAVVCPVTAGFLISILFFFRILFVQAAVEEALIYAGRATAVESCLLDDKSVLYVSAEGLFRYALYQKADVERFVSGGILGVSLLGSDTSGKEIELEAKYMVKLPIPFWGIKGIWITSKNSFVKWKGDLYTGIEQERWVYITKTGSVYHKNTSCRSLDLTIQETLYRNIHKIRGKNGQKYYPCNKCMKSMEDTKKVYFTDYGKLFHGKVSCSALKRTIERVLFSQVGSRRPCSYCY